METLRIADWLLEPELNQLSGPSGNVRLEPRTTAVLLDLAAHPGEVRSRDDILQAVWGDAFVGEAVLTHSVWELRKAFGDDAKQPRFIQTVPRRGYRLVAPVFEPGGAVVKTLLVSDLVDSTRLVERLGDERSAVLFERCDRLARDLLAKHGGQEIDKTDGYLALFERPVEAVRFALAYHQGLGELSAAAEVEIATRVGIHLGEVVLRENPGQDVAKGAKPLEVEGLAKPLTARLMSLATAGQTLLTRGGFDVARRAAEDSLPAAASLRWLAHGGYLFQGVEEAVEVFEVGREGRAPLAAPPDSKKARRVLGDGTILGWRAAPGLTIPQRPNWALERKLAEGGFGEVWLTHHKKTGAQRVFKFCVERELLRSLQREVTVFRLLKKTLGDRRDIARILDWNFDEAPYFLELEHSDSGSLADWAEAQGGFERVPLAVRLEIVAQIAEALAAAHSVGVLHKDVKPGNILIGAGRGGQPRAKLTDFGIGRITDKERLVDADITFIGMTRTAKTERGVSSGTRLYMAPEVLEGKASTIQADIYALGVVLYQAVVGELDRAVASGWRRNVDDELLAEDIAACVDVAPERRPASALEIAERLRSLEERRRRRAAERRQREEAAANRRALERGRRRRKVLGSVTAAAVLVLVVVSVLAVRENEARREADFQRQQAEELIHFMLGDLRRTLDAVGRLDAMGGTNEKVLSYFRARSGGQVSDETLAKYAEALRQIGEVHERQGDLDSAKATFREASIIAQRLVERDPDDGSLRAGLADSRYWIGSLLWSQGDFEQAGEEWEAHRTIYERLVRQDPTRSEWRLELAYGHSNVGDVLEKLGNLEDSLAQHRRGLAIIEGLIEDDPADADLRLELASSHHKIGDVRMAMGDLPGMLESFRADLEIVRGLIATAPGNTLWRDRLATSERFAGGARWVLGEPAAALEHLQAAVENQAQLVAIDPSNMRWRRNFASARGELGRMLHVQGDLDGAAEHFDSALQTFKDLVAKDPTQTGWRRDLAQQHQRTGALLLTRGDLEAALGRARKAVAMLEELIAEYPADRRILSEGYLLLGEILAEQGDEGARVAWQRALEVIEPHARSALHPEVRDLRARALFRVGRLDEARPIVDRLLAQGYREPELVELCRGHYISIGLRGSQ